MDIINCLMGGLSFEDSMGKLLESALQSMNIENFGELFAMLPPDKQAELDALVKKKLAEGDVFRDHSGHQELSDAIATEGQSPTSRPWETESSITERVESQAPPQERTLAHQYFQASENAAQLSSDSVAAAYIKAMMEVYADDLFGLMDYLNQFPGAQILANILAIMDCPRAPAFEPNFMDFLNDFEFPICVKKDDLVLPKINDPFGWMASYGDFLKPLMDAVKLAIQQALIAIIMKLLVKLCELIGKSLCKLLEAGGDIAANIGGEGHADVFGDIICESICGPDCDPEDVNTAISDLMGLLGPGGAAFADPETALQFAQDMSAASNRKEMMGAFLGDCNNEFLEIVDSLVEYDYPEYRDSLPTKESICNFFEDVGKLFPPSVKASMKDFLDSLPANDYLPANPSLCATPESLQAYNDVREALLGTGGGPDGTSPRTTPEQARDMLDDINDENLQDLGDLADILQDGLPNFLAGNVPGAPGGPPLVSQPGCDDGILPWQPEEASKAAVGALGDFMEQLKIDYSTDMLGKWRLV